AAPRTAVVRILGRSVRAISAAFAAAPAPAREGGEVGVSPVVVTAGLSRRAGGYETTGDPGRGAEQAVPGNSPAPPCGRCRRAAARPGAVQTRTDRGNSPPNAKNAGPRAARSASGGARVGGRARGG